MKLAQTQKEENEKGKVIITLLHIRSQMFQSQKEPESPACLYLTSWMKINHG